MVDFVEGCAGGAELFVGEGGEGFIDHVEGFLEGGLLVVGVDESGDELLFFLGFVEQGEGVDFVGGVVISVYFFELNQRAVVEFDLFDFAFIVVPDGDFFVVGG